MAEEKRIAYKAGITRNPSDFLCGDGELAECINLATDNEELKTMVPPSEYIHSSNIPKILYIHKHNVSDRYIVLRDTSIYWGVRNSDGSFAYDSTYDLLMTVDGTPKVTSIGKTLIIADNTGMHYFLWKEDSYLGLGEIPEVKMEFWMKQQSHIESKTTINGEFSYDNSRWDVATGKQNECNDIIIGLYTENRTKIAQAKSFCEPFFIRTALQMRDGSYTHISQPILMLPSVSRNTYFRFPDPNSNPKYLYADTHRSELMYKDIGQGSALNNWSDLISNITIFISDKINLYDLAVDQAVYNADQVFINGLYRSSRINPRTDPEDRNYTEYIKLPIGYNSCLRRRPFSEIVEEIAKKSIFYKLCEIPLDETGGGNDCHMSALFGTHDLENITTRDRLEYDDYFSRCQMIPSMMFPYNGRLNISGVSRGFFNGYDFFMPNDNSLNHSAVTNKYDIYVTIKTDSGDRIVHQSMRTKQKQGIYFYYPDPRASHVRIIKNDIECVCDRSLKEHPGLNGAYYFRLEGLSDDSDLAAAFSEINDNANNQQDSFTENPGDEIQTNVEPEQLPNYIIQSEVNNPMVFKAESYNRVGTGRILAMSTLTMALSQDPYGRTDLLVFSESGLWGMEVDRTGLYENLHPYTRDVCINPSNIIQTDFAVFFVSKKGLMKITDNGVSCVSEQMNGVTFNTDDMPGYEDIAHEDPSSPAYPWAGVIRACQEEESSFLNYIRNSSCVMAYDYIDSRIYIINPNYPFCYVYNMIDGSISKTVLEAKITNTVNNYPDYLLQGKIDNQSVVYSLYEKPREEEVRDRVMAYLLTRPMKLAGAVSQASLREMVNVGMWKRTDDNGNELSCVKSEVFVSSDMQEWYPLSSRFGAAARYFRLALYMKMLPTERLSGTIIRVQERREEHMRK